MSEKKPYSKIYWMGFQIDKYMAKDTAEKFMTRELEVLQRKGNKHLKLLMNDLLVI